jgi:hypothetical protein
VDEFATDVLVKSYSEGRAPVHFTDDTDASAECFHLRLDEEQADTPRFLVFMESLVKSKEFISELLHVYPLTVVCHFKFQMVFVEACPEMN